MTLKTQRLLKLSSLLLKCGYQKTAPVKYANGKSTKFAAYEIFIKYILSSCIFFLSLSLSFSLSLSLSLSLVYGNRTVLTDYPI